MDGTLYFTARDGAHGSELWKTDGTEAGTVLVKDIRPGTASAGGHWLTNVGGTLFFIADDGSRPELWTSDGTDVGTVLVKDIAGNAPPGCSTNAGGTLFFVANDGSTAASCGRPTEPTPAPSCVKDIRLGQYAVHPNMLTDVGDSVFFRPTMVHGEEMWKSDGTEAGTVLVKDIASATRRIRPAIPDHRRRHAVLQRRRRGARGGVVEV